ncbi:uncharacterized protein [Branchiostoma lanceolatum]|uniref:uncharacterized protein isoform X2 n=1 Tax=Branchiostoma lanceolatum TaxID=7740 RepID=UPI00345301F8
MANMEELTQINGRWQHDHSQNENYDDYLRENGMGWFARKMMQWLKFSPVEEYIVNGDQITYRNYANQNRPFEMTQTVGQPPISTFAPGFGSFQVQTYWDEYGRLVTRTRKKNGEFVQTGRIDSKGMMELTILLPSGKRCSTFGPEGRIQDQSDSADRYQWDPGHHQAQVNDDHQRDGIQHRTGVRNRMVRDQEQGHGTLGGRQTCREGKWSRRRDHHKPLH